jgi:outer membrane protein assembly factor BamB
VVPVATEAEDWTRFRGPNGSGVSEAATVPVDWTAADVNWKVELPGVGHGSPVVWGESIFVQCADEDEETRLLRCLHASDGRTLWTREFEAKTHKHHKFNSFASSTPAVDAERVYVAWGVPGQLRMAALTHDGEPLWQRDLGGFKGGHGFANSPILFDGAVILNNDQDGDSSLIALEADTGATRWEVPRHSRRTTYSTPCVFHSAERGPELIFSEWNHGVTAIDPKSGAVNWEISVFPQDSNERAIGSPVIAGDVVIATCGFFNAQRHAVAVRPQAGPKPRVEEVYRIERQVPHIPTPLVYKDLLFLWSEQGIVSCYDAAGGETHWQKRVGGNFFGSPVCINGRLYAVDDTGEVVVLAASREYEELARNALNELCRSTPAVAGGRMYVRTASHLISIGGK